MGNRKQLGNVELARGHFVVDSSEDMGGLADLACNRDHFATPARA
jgi:hypothetical protein